LVLIFVVMAESFIKASGSSFWPAATRTSRPNRFLVWQKHCSAGQYAGAPTRSDAPHRAFPPGLKETFCPATVALYIKPPFAIVKTAKLSWYPPRVFASFFATLADEFSPVVFALADADAVITIAPTSPLNSKFPEVKSSSACLFSKKIIWSRR
jgi:hypothetical protein